jgi:arylsulfatase A-like enzyme
VLATADHGESLGEHGEGTHGLFVYDSTLRVPWIVAGPGVAAGRVSATVARGIDALPTLLDYAGLPVPSPGERRPCALPSRPRDERRARVRGDAVSRASRLGSANAPRTARR